MQLRYRSQSQTGKSKRSTCHPWWFEEHTEEWHCHPLAHHLGSCPGCCTWDCRSLRTIPAHGRLPHRIRSQSLGCRSGWGWLPRPPATCSINGRAISQEKLNIREVLCKICKNDVAFIVRSTVTTLKAWHKHAKTYGKTKWFWRQVQKDTECINRPRTLKNRGVS